MSKFLRIVLGGAFISIVAPVLVLWLGEKDVRDSVLASIRTTSPAVFLACGFGFLFLVCAVGWSRSARTQKAEGPGKRAKVKQKAQRLATPVAVLSVPAAPAAAHVPFMAVPDSAKPGADRASCGKSRVHEG